MDDSSPRAQSHSARGWIADVSLLLVGLIVITAAVKNVPVNVAGRVNISLPAPGALAVQIIFGLAGFALVVRSLARLLYAEVLLTNFRLWRRNGRYARLIIAMNVLRFERRGIKHLLATYRTTKSGEDWASVMKRADQNFDKIRRLRLAVLDVENHGDLAQDFGIGHMLNEFLDDKGSLYDPIFELRDEPPTSNVVIDDLINLASDLDQRRTEVIEAQKALGRWLPSSDPLRRSSP